MTTQRKHQLIGWCLVALSATVGLVVYSAVVESPDVVSSELPGLMFRLGTGGGVLAFLAGLLGWTVAGHDRDGRAKRRHWLWLVCAGLGLAVFFLSAGSFG